MGIKERVSGWWQKLKSSVVYDVLIVPVLYAGVVASYRFVMYLFSALTALTPDETRVVAIVVTTLLVSAVSVTWAMTVRSRLRAALNVEELEHLGQGQEPKIQVLLSEPPKPAHLLSSQTKDPDIHIEILEVLLQPVFGGLLAGRDGCQILMHLRMVNRGSIEATITSWNLRVIVAEDGLPAEVMPIPTALYVERKSKSLPLDPVREQIPRPTLYESTHNPLKRGIPHDGWIMFLMGTWSVDYPGPPYNAKFALTVKDSMGIEHIGTKEPSFLQVTGTIKY